MRSFLFFTCCLTTYVFPLSAQDLSGRWTGRLYQDDIGWYDFELQLTGSGEDAYAGTSYISCERGSGTLALHAWLDSTGFHFQESRIRNEHWTVMGWYWCLKSGDLDLEIRSDSLVLDGEWRGSGTCRPGFLRVAKACKIPAPAERIVETKDVLRVQEASVVVEIWDHQTEDGDIASLRLNGETVLKNHLVTLQKHRFRIALRPGKNTLVLVAENLGARPPNTAALTLYYDGQSKTVVLSSDKTRSEAIEILH